MSTRLFAPTAILLVLSVGTAWAQTGALRLNSGGAALEARFRDAPPGFDATSVAAWLQQAADAVSDYYGRFPVERAIIDLELFNGGGTTGGRAFGRPGARISLAVGAYSEPADLARDWRLVHEMVHLALPETGARYRWLSEGLATYLESVTRARAGQLEPEFVWRGFRRGMPRGIDGDAGLDGAPERDRVYWGGALFCLLADVEIRRATDNRRGLRDALKGILEAGLDIRTPAPPIRVLQIADAAAGTGVLVDLFRSAGPGPWDPDLDALWRFLGVGDGSLDDTAPGAAIRRAITGG